MNFSILLIHLALFLLSGQGHEHKSVIQLLLILVGVVPHMEEGRMNERRVIGD